MKLKLAAWSAMVLLVTACNNESKKKFEISGIINNAPGNVKVYFEELQASSRIPPQIVDTTTLINGKFSVQCSSAEETMYRLRLGDDAKAPLLFVINDEGKATIKGDWNKITDYKDVHVNYTASTPANERFITLMDTISAVKKKLYEINNRRMLIRQSAEPGKDSMANSLYAEIMNISKEFDSYLLNQSHQEKSPVLALYTLGYWKENNKPELSDNEFQLLIKRFPAHKGIQQGYEDFKKQYAAYKQQLEIEKNKPGIGKQAPDIIMPDVNGKSFSLSSLKGKYVLVDFWASWCGPCRAENPNVVAVYNKYKDKKFTVLGVSLDTDKDKWIKAIEKDGLTWTQISDLKDWQSSAVAQYGFDVIPYNVLVDPGGTIIATGLRGGELEATLQSLLK